MGKQKPRKTSSKKRKRLKKNTRRKFLGFKLKRSRRRVSNSKLQKALSVLRDSGNISAAAKAVGISSKRLKYEALRKHVIKKRGKSWVISSDLRRQMLIYSDGKQITVTLPNQRSARNAGKYMSGVGAFLRSNNIRILDQFIDRGVKDVVGKRHIFETDPNTLYRLASSTDEAFESVYRIVVN